MLETATYGRLSICNVPPENLIENRSNQLNVQTNGILKEDIWAFRPLFSRERILKRRTYGAPTMTY